MQALLDDAGLNGQTVELSEKIIGQARAKGLLFENQDSHPSRKLRGFERNSQTEIVLLNFEIQVSYSLQAEVIAVWEVELN